MASDAIPAAVRQFQSEIDAIRHEEEPLSARATVLVFGAACLVLAVLLTIARVDRVVSSTGGKIVSVDAPLVLQALDPSIVKSIDVREGEVVEKDRLLAALDPTFAVADVHQLRVQIDSLNAQITREEAELAHKAPDFLTASDPSSQRYEVLQKALFDQRAAQYSAQLEGFDQKIALTQATIDKYQNDESRYRDRLSVAEEIEGMRNTLAQHGNESRLNLLGSTDARLEALRTMEFDHSSRQEAEHQLHGAKADRATFVQQWFSQISQDLNSRAQQSGCGDESAREGGPTSGLGSSDRAGTRDGAGGAETIDRIGAEGGRHADDARANERAGGGRNRGRQP